jgi:acetyl esterase/lipase
VAEVQPELRQKMTEATPSPAWYDAQYNNRARIPEHPEILAHWAEASARAYERPGWVLDVAYGEDRSERLDVLPAERPGAPVLVYIHGGYWRALDKRDQSFVAPPFADAGAMVVLANYALCPAVTLERIVLQLVQALAWVHRNARTHGGDPGRIVVAGHSAGGHLATMLLACQVSTSSSRCGTRPSWPPISASMRQGRCSSALRPCPLPCRARWRRWSAATRARSSIGRPA